MRRSSRPRIEHRGQNRGVKYRLGGNHHLACAVPTIDWGVSLTHFYLAEDIVKDPLPLRDGLVSLPINPGLGVEVDEDAVRRFQVEGL